MVASCNRPEGGLRTSLWLGVMMLLALPSEVGYQDLATLLMRQPVVNRAQKTAFAEQFAQAKRNFEVGTATITDTHEAQARYDLTIAQEIAARNELELRRRALEQIIARNAPAN